MRHAIWLDTVDSFLVARWVRYSAVGQPVPRPVVATLLGSLQAGHSLQPTHRNRNGAACAAIALFTWAGRWGNICESCVFACLCRLYALAYATPRHGTHNPRRKLRKGRTAHEKVTHCYY